MKYQVSKRFKDTHDNDHIYAVGDKYPRKGKLDKERLMSLTTTNNNCGEPFVVEIGEGDE